MDEKGNSFEKIFLHQFYLKLLREWDYISSEHLQLFSAPISLKIAKNCITPDKIINQQLIEQSFKSVSKYFNEKRTINGKDKYTACPTPQTSIRSINCGTPKRNMNIQSVALGLH